MIDMNSGGVYGASERASERKMTATDRTRAYFLTNMCVHLWTGLTKSGRI